jgi:DsbC/DsbD-like thiol-disulfide interchange protein
MNTLIFPGLAALVACMIPASAIAGASVWEKVEGGSVRLVTEGLPDAEGRLRGALEIRLNPGWKTYWRDPGEAGIPPMVTVTWPQTDASTEIGFPTPKRFDDGYSVWAGYDEPVTLPLTFDLAGGGMQTRIDASVFLGICEVICIPVQAEFGIDLTDSSEAATHHRIVEDAFAALPQSAHAGFEAVLREADAERAMIDIKTPDNAADPELFVASTERWAFGTPEPAEGPAFHVPVLSAPEPDGTADTIHYTLVAGGDAVSGTFEISQ